mmetsp:Transcript_28753/g.70895  ORF Transcript_28753/g.70895 Transcript_28753/m.70895 type:complete len:83 (-) Transcript_28753:86-334(-)
MSAEAAANTPAPVATATAGNAVVGNPKDTTRVMAANMATAESDTIGTAPRRTAVAAGAEMTMAAGRMEAKGAGQKLTRCAVT